MGKDWRFMDLTGHTYGRFTVLERVPGRPMGKTWWVVRCSCGTVKQVRQGDLRNGKTRSCGCYFRDERRAQGPDHRKRLEEAW